MESSTPTEQKRIERPEDLDTIWDEALKESKDKRPVPVTKEEIAKEKKIDEILNFIRGVSTDMAKETMIVPEDDEETKHKKELRKQEIEFGLKFKQMELTLGSMSNSLCEMNEAMEKILAKSRSSKDRSKDASN